MRLYSINGLAVEFGIDRRTVAKKLRQVPPADSRELGDGRIERRWRLDQVVDRLRDGELPDDVALRKEYDELTQRLIGAVLFPRLVCAPQFMGTIVGFAKCELHVTPAQAELLRRVVTVALGAGLQDAFPDVVLRFTLPDEAFETRAGEAARE